MRDNILTEVENTTQNFIDLIASFPENKLTVVPAAGSWTAAQVADHILKSFNWTLDVLHSQGKQSQRPPDQYVNALRDQFLNFTTKLKSPDFILPGNSFPGKEKVAQALERARQQLREAFGRMDLTEICSAAPLGEMTRLEMFYLVIFHTQRHTEQLRNLKRSVEGVEL